LFVRRFYLFVQVVARPLTIHCWKATIHVWLSNVSGIGNPKVPNA
jgi:hypothetical protein